MEERLQGKVQSLRSQGLTFAKDGFDFTLDVPDTGDVKSIFGTMAETIVSQEKVINGLNESLEETTTTFKKAQEEMMAWAQAKFDELNEKNAVLAGALRDARSQLKNFSYNVQGFEDTSASDDFEQKLKAIDQLKVPAKEEAILFPTEDGAPLKRALSTADQSPAAKPKPKERLNLLDTAMRGNSMIIEDGLTAVQRMTPKHRWIWAYKKILAKVRKQALCLGFTQTRQTKSESVLERIQRIEERMFFLPIETRQFASDLHDNVMERLGEEISRLEADQSAYSVATTENLKSLDHRIVTLSGDIGAVQKDLAGVRDSLEKAVTSQSKKLQDDIDSMRKQHSAEVDRQHNTLTAKLHNLLETFTSLEAGAPAVSKDVITLIEKNGKMYKKGGDDSISAILQVDTGMRRLRESVGQMESDLFTVRAIAQTLKDEVARSLSSSVDEDTRQVVANLDRILSQGVPTLLTGIEGAKAQIRVHDDILAERWLALSGVMKAVGNISGLSDKLEKIECELENKVAVSEVRSIGRDLATAALDEFQRPIEDRLSAITAGLETQKAQIAAIEEEMRTLPDKIQPTVIAAPAAIALSKASSTTATPRNSAAVHAMSEMMAQPSNWNPAEMEPLIRDIVNVYLAEWNNGSGGDDDEGEYFNEETEESGAIGEDEAPANDEEHVNSERVGTDDVDKKNGHVSAQTPLTIDTEAVDTDPPLAANSATKSSPRVSPRAVVAVVAEASTASPATKPINDMTDDTSPTITTKKTIVQSPQCQAPPPSNPPSQSRPSPPSNEEAAKKKSMLPPIATTVPNKRSQPSPTAPTQSDILSPSQPQSRPPNQTLMKKSSSMSDAPEDIVPARKRMMGRGDAADLAKIRAEMKELQDKLDALNRTKIDVESVRTLLAQKADTKMVEKKVDSRVVSAIETAVGDVMLEIGNLKNIQQVELDKVKENLAMRIKTGLKAVLEERTGGPKGAVASYKGLCLSCGQSCNVPMTSGHTNPPPFLPALNSSSTVGPEVYRGGFRMPVGSVSDSLFASEADGFPEYDGGDDSSFHTFGTKPPPSKQGKRMKTPTGPPILLASASYVEEASSARSIHRKGLPGKTSNRAVAAYAPERFELTHAELSSKSAPLVTRLPRAKPSV